MSSERTTTAGMLLGIAIACGFFLLIVTLAPDAQNAIPEEREHVYLAIPGEGGTGWEYAGYISPAAATLDTPARWRGVPVDHDYAPRICGSRNEAARYITSPAGSCW